MRTAQVGGAHDGPQIVRVLDAVAQHQKGLLAPGLGGAEQIGARIAYNEIDMVLFFCDPSNPQYNDSLTYITKLCDQNNIPFATNLATAEMLIMGLARGDLDWRDIVHPQN